MVYFDYYGGGLEKAISKARRGRIIQGITAVSRDLIVLLEVSPELAVERIDARIAEERKQATSAMREKWRHIHENVADLADLARGYDEALDAIESLGDTEIVRIPTDDLSKDEVVGIAKDAIVNAYDKKRAKDHTGYVRSL